MVNTEQIGITSAPSDNYNILNIVVNTEHNIDVLYRVTDYNILNIVVNTEPTTNTEIFLIYYNILNIVVNTEQFKGRQGLF